MLQKPCTIFLSITLIKLVKLIIEGFTFFFTLACYKFRLMLKFFCQTYVSKRGSNFIFVQNSRFNVALVSDRWSRR